MKDQFIANIQQGYTFSGDALVLGCAMFDKTAVDALQVKVPLKTMNRHGLIAGATGTGKTKTLQALTEALSAVSVPTLVMDIKGDLSGIAAAGTANPKIEDRVKKIGVEWTPHAFPVELLSLSDQPGVRLRATISEFGPVLISKILGLNDTQGGVLALIFKFCDDQALPLLDLKDLKKVLQYIGNEGKEQIEAEYGAVSPATTGTILRKIIELEQQGADIFFGEKSFEVEDLLRVDDMGYGKIHVLRLNDLQDRPKLFSTFMLQLLAEIYATFPEAGDLDAPKLVLFIDEAHLIFQEASEALMEQIETIIKLIRSKGVGIFFCTQNPADIPDAVLSQLGMKVQHALRAFTAKDQKAIRLAADNFPITPYYKTEDLLLELGIGEALVTVLNEKGIPTPLVHTLMTPPRSRMDVLTDAEIGGVVSGSKLAAKYNQELDRESAYEMLEAKIAEFEEAEKQAELKKQQEEAEKQRAKQEAAEEKARAKEKSVISEVANSGAGKTVLRELTRGLLGVLGIGGKSSRTTTRKKKSGWFW